MDPFKIEIISLKSKKIENALGETFQRILLPSENLAAMFKKICVKELGIYWLRGVKFLFSQNHAYFF